jgi:hypothetical protein
VHIVNERRLVDDIQRQSMHLPCISRAIFTASFSACCGYAYPFAEAPTRHRDGSRRTHSYSNAALYDCVRSKGCDLAMLQFNVQLYRRSEVGLFAAPGS